MSKGKEAGKIQVYVRVRPFTEREKDKREVNAIEIHQEHSLIRVLDPRSRTNYFFDGVFSPEASNQEVYLKVGKPLVYAALNGYKGTLLTYGQTGTGKTFTLLSDDGVTTRVVQHCFEKIANDEIHNYKVMCSFLQVYQEKVYDLLNPRFTVDLPVREHPKKGVYVANLTQHEVKSAGDVFALLEIGKQHLVIAETKMVRHSSRSHSIMQLIIERRLKAHIANEKPPSKGETTVSHEAVQESIMAVDETINNLIKELKQERKSHHKRERECLKELMEKELNNGNNFEGDLIVKGKINLCDLAGSERLTKTKAEGVRLTEAKYLNTSLLELGNVIHALARGHKRHVPYRNSTLTRLLQDCLGDNGKTNFIICIAPSLGEVNETKCSLNFGLRAMRITNVARLNVEVDYKVLAERLAKKLEDQEIKYKFEKLEYLREIQRLKSAISCYQESENFAGKDHEKLVTVIANLSKSVQREKEEKNNLQTELVCLKKQVSQPIGTSAPDVEAVLLAELMSMELLANLQNPDAAKGILLDDSLPAKVKSHLALADTQETLLNNAGCFLQLLDLHLDTELDANERKRAASDAKEYLQFNLSKAGSVELFSKDCSIKISPRGVPKEPCLSLPMYNSSPDENSSGLAGGVRRMLGKLMGRESKDRTSVSPGTHPSGHACSVPSGDVTQRGHDQEDPMIKTKALLTRLTSSKEKVEQQVLSLLSTLFDEQITKNEGQCPQWNELGNKLTKLIMFRRNNMPGLSEADMWANSEDLNAILENCLRFVIIDKALLACLLVIELLDLRQVCGTLEDKRKLANHNASGESTATNSSPQSTPPVKTTGGKKSSSNSKEIGSISPTASVSPRREKLKSLKHTKTELEKEITEMHEDTTFLETELFSTMEERTKVEEELYGIKSHVTKLRSELFHLKLEKSNLESDVKKSKSQENLEQSGNFDGAKSTFESPKEPVPRGYPELSDVMEASHESNDSENSSQMSDGNETREAFLKTCMENISKIYTLMPEQAEEIASEDEISDEQEPTLSDANIDDSDEEIIITKLARSLRSPCASPSKEKTFDASSPHKSGQKQPVVGDGQKGKSNIGNEVNEDLGGKSREALIKQIQELKRKLHKAENELTEAREANEDLEEELDHKKGQLAEAQVTITNLENQIVDEKETCEEVRQQYFNVKTQNEILDGKLKALRSETERLLRDSNSSNAVFRSPESLRRDNPLSPLKTKAKSPLRSPTKAKVPKIDLRTPPQKQLVSNEIEFISLVEENAELKVKLGNATQEKVRLEKSLKIVEEKSFKMKTVIQTNEDACSRFKEEVSEITKEKVRLSGEITDLRNTNSSMAEELQRYREKSTRLEKDIEAIAYMSTRLEKNNKILEMEISKMESELCSWKAKHELLSQECQRLDQENQIARKDREKALLELGAIKKEKSHLLEQQFSITEETVRREKQLKDNEERFFELEAEVTEQKRLNANLQKELAGMAEYQEALESEYSKAKNEEDKLKQELAIISSRVIEFETELASATQNTQDHGLSTEQKSSSLSLRATLTDEPSHRGKSFSGTPSKKFYTITHTSEDEIADTSSSIAESPADEGKIVEHENQLLKLENGYLQQQLAESERVLALYRQDLESAHDLIDKLQAEVKTYANETKNEATEDECKTPSDKDDTVQEIEGCSESTNDEYKLLEEKHAELTREYEILRRQYQEAVTEKEKGINKESISNAALKKVTFVGEKASKKITTSQRDVVHQQNTLQDRITELESENMKLKVAEENLVVGLNTNRQLERSLEDAKRVQTTLEERIAMYESEKKDNKLKQTYMEEQVARLQEENEKSRAELLERTRSTSHPLNFQQIVGDVQLGKRAVDNEPKVRKLEEDLLKVTSDKLKLEFELRSANADCERLKSDLHQSESERNLLTTQLNDNIERAANLEIRLMEMRCSCQTIKDEINTLKNQKRQESFHLHEASVCKEILEKRLEDALKENNSFHHELEAIREEREETMKKIAKLEIAKEELIKEIDEVRKQREVKQKVPERTTHESKKANGPMNKEASEESNEYRKLHREDQEQVTILQDELRKITEDHSQLKMELQEIKSVKELLEKQIEHIKAQGLMANEDDPFASSFKPQTAKEEEQEMSTNDEKEIEEKTKLLEKEKGLLEKELTRVQDECNKLKQKLSDIKLASEPGQEDHRNENEERQEHLEIELERLRDLNKKLENECEDSNKLIQELEVKTKALESLEKELHCFHEENDRLTQEVDIIQHTSKAITDHQSTKESLEAEKSLLKKELESIHDCNRKLQARIDDMGKELEIVTEQREKVSSIEKMNASLNNEIDKLQTMHQHLESELATTHGKIKEMEITNDALKKENKALKGRINNEVHRRKDDHKRVPSVGNKLKDTLKQEQSVAKEDKASSKSEGENGEDSENDSRQMIEQHASENTTLKDELDSVTKNTHDSHVPDQDSQSVTVLKKTTEPQPENEEFDESKNNKLTSSRDQETNTESGNEKVSAPFSENVKAGLSLMAKENLLLEKKASYFVRAQVQLEQSLSKAMKENTYLKNKVSETENVLNILRERVHELEKNSGALPLIDLKKSVMLSSDSESDCDANELPNSDDKTEGQRMDNEFAGLLENTEEGSKMGSSHEDGELLPVPSNVDKLQRELEEVTKELENLKSQREMQKINSIEKRDFGTQSEEDATLLRQEQENILLKQERQSLLQELEAATNQNKAVENDLKQNKESCIKQEQEIKLLLSSYSQEKESLLKELESTRLDCRKAKEKLRELQQIDSEFADIQKKSTEAEKLVTELEKELLCQTEMKNELRRELQNCQNKLQEIEQLETQLRTCRREIEDLHAMNNQLKGEMEKRKDENNNLIDELKTVRVKLRSLEKQKKQSMNRGANIKNHQDQSVQTYSAVDIFVNRDQEGPKDITAATDVEESENAVACQQYHDINSHRVFPQSSEVRSESNKSNKAGDNEAQELNSSEINKTLMDNNRFQGLPIPIIIITQEDDTATINNESSTGLNLCLEDFEKDSPNDQSTPDEENQQNTSPMTTKDDVEPSMYEQIIPMETSLYQEQSAVKSEVQTTKENLTTKSDSEGNGEQTLRNGENNQEIISEPEDGSKKDELTGSPPQKDVQRDEDLPDDGEEESLSLRSRRELEWTISNLKSELQQRSEDHEKNQQEIGSLEEQQLSMKREIVSLLSECESLRAKVAILQTQNEAVLKEQILNDEENEELQQNMQDLLEEKNSIEEAKKKLESEKARLEIELSDAIETREAVEGELLRSRAENASVSKHTTEGQWYDISERYAKLETVLSCVLDENSKMTAELSALKAENSMLKSFKIMEITDNCTQFSPRTTEDESDGDRTHSSRKSTSSITQHSRLGEDLTNQLHLASPKSTEANQVKGDEEGTTTDEFPVTPTPIVEVNLKSETFGNRFGDEQRQMEKNEVPTLIKGDNGREHRAAVSAESSSLLPLAKRNIVESTELEAISVGKSLRKKHQRKALKESSSLHKKHYKADGAEKVESDDHDSSMEVHTSSSLVSITDLDVSISSDQISSEDSSIVGSEIRVLQRMQKELAETKCSNVLVKNELAIIRKHNADLQSQVQKLLSRNNHLKTKMCDKALSVKRMEKEVSNIKEENNKLQQQAMILQDEMARVEKEKAKFERNMSATKSENKRLKSDLSNIKAESYRTMKELVNLQSENRKLQLDIERLREDSRRLNGPCSDDSASHELPFWGSVSHGDRSTSRRSLQEKQVKQNTTHLHDRVISDLTFCQRQTSKEDSQGPELSPLNLSEELQKQDTDDDQYGKTLIGSGDSISSEDRSRYSEPVSRRGSQLSFTSEASHPGEGSDPNEIEHHEKTEDEHEDELGGKSKSKSKKKIKTILRKFQHSKKTKSSK